MTLDMLASELPEKYVESKIFPINFPVSRLSCLICGEKNVNISGEGVRLTKEKGRLLVIPERGGEKIKVFAEADTMEAANELCSDIEEIIGSLTD